MRSEAAIAKFSIGDIDVSLLNIYLHLTNAVDSQIICSRLKECFTNKDDVFIVLGDFTEFSRYIGKPI